MVARQPRMEDIGNTHYLPYIHGERIWEILVSYQTAKKRGCGKYLILARKPRREDMGNTH